MAPVRTGRSGLRHGCGGIGATDWVDGWWARKFDVISEFGKFVDPLTDRVALIVPILAIAIEGAVPWWLGIVTLAREGLVALAGLGAQRERAAVESTSPGGER